MKLTSSVRLHPSPVNLAHFLKIQKHQRRHRKHQRRYPKKLKKFENFWKFLKNFFFEKFWKIFWIFFLSGLACSLYYLQSCEILSAGLKPVEFLPLARSSPVKFCLWPGPGRWIFTFGPVKSCLAGPKPGEFLLTGRSIPVNFYLRPGEISKSHRLAETGVSDVLVLCWCLCPLSNQFDSTFLLSFYC